MVDNRAAGFYGVSGALNFKSGDISGTAAKMSDDKAGSDAQYMKVEAEDVAKSESAKHTDRSAHLNAALSSLAMLNVSSIISSRIPKIKQSTKRFKELIDETEELILALGKDQDDNEKNSKNPFKKEESPFESDENEEDEYF